MNAISRADSLRRATAPSKVSFPRGCGPKWRIQKQELWTNHGQPWQILPPLERYNSFEQDITTFATGAEALAAFSHGTYLTLNGEL